jgi:hypothetical protein
MAALNSFKEAGMRKLTGWFVVMLVAVVAVSFAFVNVVGVTYAQAQGDKKDDMKKDDKKTDKMDKKAEKKDKKAEKEKKADKMDKKAAKMEKKAEKKEEKKEAEKK